MKLENIILRKTPVTKHNILLLSWLEISNIAKYMETENKLSYGGYLGWGDEEIFYSYVVVTIAKIYGYVRNTELYTWTDEF